MTPHPLSSTSWGSGRMSTPPLQGFEYQARSGQCCGECVQMACVMNTSDSSAHLFYVSRGCQGRPGGPQGLGVSPGWGGPWDPFRLEARPLDPPPRSSREARAQGRAPYEWRACEVHSDSGMLSRQGPGIRAPGQLSLQGMRLAEARGTFWKPTGWEDRQTEAVPTLLEGGALGRDTHHAGRASLQPGKSWSDPGNRCVTYECEKHRDGLVVVTTRKACPQLSCPLVSSGNPLPHLAQHGPTGA